MRNEHSKIGTIIRHEYTSKIRSKGFIIATFIAPLLFAVFIGFIVMIGFMMDDTDKRLAVIDETGYIGTKFVEGDKEKFFLSQEDPGQLKNKIKNGKLDGYVMIPSDILDKGEARIVTSGGGGIALISAVESGLDEIVRTERLKRAGADEKTIRLVEEGISISTEKVTEKGDTEKDHAEGMAALGYIMGLAIYFLVFVYGSFVSRGVIEEKANRIIEIIASSARPFEIMMGKVVGIGLVGITQVLIWIILMFTVSGITTAVLAPDAKQATELSERLSGNAPVSIQPAGQDQSEVAAELTEFLSAISPMLIAGFFFFFIGGYFMYATLFAAVGSAVDTEQDAAQLQLPITLPVIMSIMLIQPVMANPDGPFAIFLSMFPISSPIIMTARMAATNVPAWQLAASMLILVGGFLAAVWFASRVYRIGILMTGKKPKFGDLIKWIKM